MYNSLVDVLNTICPFQLIGTLQIHTSRKYGTQVINAILGIAAVVGIIYVLRKKL
jgi:hypothetical protein